MQSKKFQPLPAVIAASENLLWSIEVTKSGRQVVALSDIPAGTDVLVEHPVITNVIGKFSQAFCHRCLNYLGKPVSLEEGVNPCLPKYCATCKANSAEDDTKLDAALLPIRIQMHKLAIEQDLDTILLQLILMVEVEGARSNASNPGPCTPKKSSEAGKPVVQSTHAEVRALPSLWEKKPESWRKRAAIAIRGFHKELIALSETKAIPGYEPSTIPQLQELATVLLEIYKPVTGDQGSRESGVGVFPVSSLFKHSCIPNCFSKTSGRFLTIRTAVDVPKGCPLTLSIVPLFAPRSARQEDIMNLKGFQCVCERCTQPLHESNDRFLDGILCQHCGMDVFLPVAPEDTEAASKVHKEQVEQIRKAQAKKEGKAKAGKVPNKTAKSNDSVAHADEEESKVTEEEEESHEYWKCCHCGVVETATNDLSLGPGDILSIARKYIYQGRYQLQSREPAKVKEGEDFLAQVAKEPRLQFGNALLLDTLPILINNSLRKEDWLNVQMYAAQLYEKQNFILPMFTPSTLGIVDAYIHACKKKSEGAGSAVVKKSMEKKAKDAEKLRAQVAKVLGESE